MAKPVEYGTGSFGISITGNSVEEIRWYHTKAGRDSNFDKMKEIAGSNMKFKKVNKLG